MAMDDVRRTGLAILLAGLLTSGAAAAGQSGEQAHIAVGRELAERYCASCHVIGPGQGRGSDQAPPFRAIATRPVTTADSLHAFLLRPHGGMPPLTLSNEQIDNLAAYILSLRR
jgi:mono/diheme cytochrome c family protein